VNVQAESPYRLQPEDIGHLRTRNLAGEMIPLGSVVHVTPIFGPDRVMHYNGFPAAEINGAAAPGYSTGQSEGAIAKVLNDQLPNGMKYEWTELTYQKILAGNTMVYIFPLSVFLVYLVLAAQYESWSLPLVIILIVPMTLFSAIAGVWLLNGDNNVFTQISLIVLVGLACKNAILIVEFAREKQLQEGMNRVDAVLEACRLRLRPILMTSLAFTMGVIPLVLSTGAGSEMRRAIGVAVFFGMRGVTAFGLVLTPVFYVLVQRLVEGRENKKVAGSADLSPATSVEA
jgi:multidrug efflux pump